MKRETPNARAMRLAKRASRLYELAKVATARAQAAIDEWQRFLDQQWGKATR